MFVNDGRCCVTRRIFSCCKDTIMRRIDLPETRSLLSMLPSPSRRVCVGIDHSLEMHGGCSSEWSRGTAMFGARGDFRCIRASSLVTSWDRYWYSGVWSGVRQRVWLTMLNTMKLFSRASVDHKRKLRSSPCMHTVIYGRAHAGQQTGII